jgi:hypothetical protein
LPLAAVLEPDAGLSGYYEELFALYQTAFDQLAPLCERLLALRPPSA